MYTKKGTPRQVNQGGYDWSFEETPDGTKIIFTLDVPKFMDTSSLNIDLQPTFIRCEIKNKVTQLMLPEEVLVESSVVQRSQTTGQLVVTMPRANISEIEAKNMRLKALREKREKEEELKELERKQKEAKENAFRGIEQRSIQKSDELLKMEEKVQISKKKNLEEKKDHNN